MTTGIGHAVIGLLYVLIISMGLLLVSSCLLDHESTSTRSSIRRIGKYLSSGPVSLGFAALICMVYFLLAVTGSNEHVRVEYGLPNNNGWAYIGYAFLHADWRHLAGNVGGLLICGGLIEEKLGRGRFMVFILICIPLGGYLSVLSAPIFINSPWDDGLTSVGFSIVGNAIFILCTYFIIIGIFRKAWFKRIATMIRTFGGVARTEGPSAILAMIKTRILLALKECEPQFNPFLWSARTNRVVALTSFLFVFSIGVDDGTPESVLGHSVGLVLGAIAAMACLVMQRIQYSE